MKETMQGARVYYNNTESPVIWGIYTTSRSHATLCAFQIERPRGKSWTVSIQGIQHHNDCLHIQMLYRLKLSHMRRIQSEMRCAHLWSRNSTSNNYVRYSEESHSKMSEQRRFRRFYRENKGTEDESWYYRSCDGSWQLIPVSQISISNLIIQLLNQFIIK
uniref:Uncharacterized protein n=1 Tax=Spironucleus salmonicida TaxID=348837 RepID=V6LVB1_9EUKA|eukprot:EST44729.1 Hypothetical protein SS50377_15382 [Spironucleus salmonicida]